jgi:hypothetical protein
VIATFRVAETLGFKGDFRQWEDLLRIEASNELLGCETMHRVFVPVYPCAGVVADNRDAFLAAQRLYENWVPPISVLQQMRCRSAAQEARTDLWPQVAGNLDTFGVRERSGSEPTS